MSGAKPTGVALNIIAPQARLYRQTVAFELHLREQIMSWLNHRKSIVGCF